MSLFVPKYYARSIYDIPLEFYKKENIKIIFCDLDNTLDAFYENEPTAKALELVEKFKKNNIEFIITSNNHGDRVHRYAEKLNVECHYSSKKPLSYKLNKFIKKKGFNKSDILMIGDQELTDVICSKLLKVRCLLTEPLVKNDLPVTKINRFIDKRIRKIIRKKLLKVEVKNEQY